MSDPSANALSNSICMGCGMCCDGTLFGRASLEPEEEPMVKAAQAEILEEDGRTYFRIPCNFFACGKCTIYEDRFKVCRTFACALFRRLERDELSADAAREIVEKALELRRKITAVFPEAGVFRNRQALRARLAEQLASNTPSNRKRTAQSLLDIVAFDIFLERWFRNKKIKDQQTADRVDDPANS